MRLSVIYYRYELEEQYAPLLGRLDLPLAKREALMGRLLDKKFTELDARDLLGGPELHRGNAGMVDQPKIDALVASEMDREIHALLGDDAFERYCDFERTRWVRQPVTRLAERLTIVGMPLSPDQQDKLMELVFAETQPNARTGRYYALRFSKSAVEKAQAVLTPKQWNELRQLENQNDAMDRFFRGTVERIGVVNKAGAKKAAEKVKGAAPATAPR